MHDDTHPPHLSGIAPFSFGIHTGNQKSDIYQLRLLIGGIWYETNAVFSNHLKATEFVSRPNDAIADAHPPPARGEPISFAFNSLYEQAHDSHRLILHLKAGVILTGYLIDADRITPNDFCRAMNRQTRLSEQNQQTVILHGIKGQTDINQPITLH